MINEKQKFYLLLTAVLLILGAGLIFFLGTEKKEEKEIRTFEKNEVVSPTMNLGYGGAKYYTPELELRPDLAVIYKYDKPLEFNQVGLNGIWFVERDRIVSLSDDSILAVNFQASIINISLSGNNYLPVRVELDGKRIGEIPVSGSGVYAIKPGNTGHSPDLLKLYIPRGIALYSLSFN